MEISAYDIMTLMKLLETAHMSSTKSEELFFALQWMWFCNERDVHNK